MEASFKEFKKEIQHYCHITDFKENQEKLQDLKISSYATFVILLERGGEITPSIKVCEEIFNMSTVTQLTETEIIKLSSWFRTINSIIDVKEYG